MIPDNNVIKETDYSKFAIEAEGDVPAEVVNHIRKMIVPASKVTSKCVDGGYHENEAVGELARPGGDLGICLTLMKMGLSPEEAFQVVYEYRISKGQKFGWHTDTHEGHNGSICGCGHCNAAYAHAEKYGVTSGDVLELLNLIREKTDSDPENMIMVKLTRDHKEQGIIVVANKNFTVKPWDEEANRQYFIYDADRDQELLSDIFYYLREKYGLSEQNSDQEEGEQLAGTEAKISIKGKLYTFQDMVDADSAERNATLGLLESSQGQPMYQVSLEKNTIKVKAAGKAPVQA